MVSLLIVLALVILAGSALALQNRVADPGLLDPNRIFDRFYTQSSSQDVRAKSNSGSGLGLAIVAQLTQAMGAQISAQLKGDLLRIKLQF